MRRRFAGMLAVVVAASMFSFVAPASAEQGTGSPNMSHVTNLQYELRYGQTQSYGTDIEFKTLQVNRPGKRGGKQIPKDFAFAGTYRNGLQILDVTDPTAPQVASVYDCAIAQGDVQVFDRDGRTYVGYTADNIASQTVKTSGCYTDLGLQNSTQSPYGTFFADVTDPYNPTTVGFARLPAGAHNITIHPSGNYLYNSNSDLVNASEPVPTGKIEVFDIHDLSDPQLVKTLDLGPGLNSHDITFNDDGSRAYSAAVTHTLVLDTTTPADPQIIGRIPDNTINIHHQSDPVTIDDPVLGERTFLVITDELAGAAGNGACPGGGLHVFDITGNLERSPVKVGFFDIPEARPAGDGVVGGDSLRCTSHVLRMYPDEEIMTIAWYNAGVRVIDISGLAGVSAGVTPETGSLGMGMKEIGHYYFPNSDTWSAKTNRIAPDGSFYVFANDTERGLDVFHFDSAAQQSSSKGRWLDPTQAKALFTQREAVATSGGRTTAFCLIPVDR